jgi:hypothetical protein
MVGLHLIKHMDGLSDEAVCARFLDSPYVVAREERGQLRDSWGFRPAQVFAFARSLSATGENLANPRSC